MISLDRFCAVLYSRTAQYCCRTHQRRLALLIANIWIRTSGQQNSHLGKVSQLRCAAEGIFRSVDLS